jgi:hypothetical protein
MSKTNISCYLTDLYGTVNPLCLKINFVIVQRKLRHIGFEIGSASSLQVGFDPFDCAPFGCAPFGCAPFDRLRAGKLTTGRLCSGFARGYAGINWV